MCCCPTNSPGFRPSGSGPELLVMRWMVSWGGYKLIMQAASSRILLQQGSQAHARATGRRQGTAWLGCHVSERLSVHIMYIEIYKQSQIHIV